MCPSTPPASARDSEPHNPSPPLQRLNHNTGDSLRLWETQQASTHQHSPLLSAQPSLQCDVTINPCLVIHWVAVLAEGYGGGGGRRESAWGGEEKERDRLLENNGESMLTIPNES